MFIIIELCELNIPFDFNEKIAMALVMLTASAAVVPADVPDQIAQPVDAVTVLVNVKSNTKPDRGGNHYHNHG